MEKIEFLKTKANYFDFKDVGEVSVELTGRDIIGLGFDICGNMKDGIFVQKMLNKGPANDSRLIKPGRLSICMPLFSFRYRLIFAYF